MKVFLIKITTLLYILSLNSNNSKSSLLIYNDSNKSSREYYQMIQEGEQLFNKYGRNYSIIDSSIVKIDSFYALYQNGLLRAIGRMKNNERNGIWHHYYDTSLISTVNYMNDSTYGIVILYNIVW